MPTTIPAFTHTTPYGEVTCPELVVPDGTALLEVLSYMSFPEVLEKAEYICHALEVEGLDASFISDALEGAGHGTCLENLVIHQTRTSGGYGCLRDLVRALYPLRLAWCAHMRKTLEDHHARP